MYSLIQLAATGRKRQWVLMDTMTCLPLLYPLRYSVDHLAFRSLSTQSASLQAIKYFYEFWLLKHHVTFCYSFHSSGHDPSIAFNELTSFFHYLENGRSSHTNVIKLPHSPGATSSTNALRIRAVISFITFLINTYLSPMYQDGLPKDLSRRTTELHRRLLICKEDYRTIMPKSYASKGNNPHYFRSMTIDMINGVYRIIVPSSVSVNNNLNPFPTGGIQFRNYLIFRLLLNYGLRVGELLLLECSSIKPNISNTKYSLIVTSAEMTKDNRRRAPSLKNDYANRVLELESDDYRYINIYIEKIRPKTSEHNFIFTDLRKNVNPLSYNAVYAIFSKVDSAIDKIYPEFKSADYFDAIERLTPHITRHTWASLMLSKLYRDEYQKQLKIAELIDVDFSIAGLMNDAKDKLRELGGWSHTSHMPSVYAKRFLSQQANTANIKRIRDDSIKSDSALLSFIEELNYVIK
ncbi:site-specific tyrosine recombinase XerC [compost metagenome]